MTGITPNPNQNTAVRIVDIDSGHHGQRIDNYLVTLLKGVPKTHIYRLLRKGEVRVNKGRIKPDYRLQTGDAVRIPPLRIAAATEHERVSDGLVQLLEDRILYEDESIIIVDKPAGLAVHGGSGVKLGLIEAMRPARPQARFLELVHRLDRDTSGCILLAKKRAALLHLHEAIKSGKVEKNYLALVKGRWPNRRKRVDVPLNKNHLASGERVVRVDSQGKSALTLFEVIRHYTECTLVKASPVTGRTHQIRVHAMYSDCPIVGDEKYGDKAFDKLMKAAGFRRLCLHAASLSFSTQDGRKIHVEAPLPEDIQKPLSRLLPLKS